MCTFTPIRNFVVRASCLIALIASAGQSRLVFAQGPGGPPVVDVAKVIQREVQASQAFVASVMPSRTSDVGSAVDGRVVEFPIRDGDYVEKGQVIAQLLTGLLEIEKKAAEAERDLRQHELLELERGMRPEEIERARAQLASRKALWDYAQSRLERVQRLSQNRTLTEDELQDAISRAEQTEQLYLEAKADHEMAVKGHREEKISQARARLAMAEEAVNRIDDQLMKHTIRSPFNGYVVQEYTQVGAWVPKAGLVAKIIELDEVDVECQVLESYLPFVQEGMEARVEIPALPNEVLIGTVHRVVPQGDLRSRSFPVKIRLQNKLDANHRPLIRAGMYARVHLPVGKKSTALLVPKDALVLGGAGAIYVVDQDGSVRPVSVQLGSSWEGYVEVQGNLKAGERVVVRGNERLMPGAKVKIGREI